MTDDNTKASKALLTAFGLSVANKKFERLAAAKERVADAAERTAVCEISALENRRGYVQIQ